MFSEFYFVVKTKDFCHFCIVLLPHTLIVHILTVSEKHELELGDPLLRGKNCTLRYWCLTNWRKPFLQKPFKVHDQKMFSKSNRNLNFRTLTSIKDTVGASTISFLMTIFPHTHALWFCTDYRAMRRQIQWQYFILFRMFRLSYLFFGFRHISNKNKEFVNVIFENM